MARSNPRLVVGVGAISAFLLFGGPGIAVAIAEPGHSGRGDRDNSDRNWGDYGGGPKRGGYDGGDRRGGGGDNRRSDGGFGGSDDAPSFGGNGGPQSRVGSGRTDVQQLSPEVGSDSNDRSGSDHPGAPSAKFEPPKVTVGNGRSPGVQDDDREPRNWAPTPEPAPEPPPPPPPAPAPAPSWVDRIYTPPAMPKQLGVTPTSSLTDPLWGIAGLLLIPAAGAVLGYRQARAAKAAAELGRA
ncbi:MAG TPA: hypothetical protein VJ777_27480 [Mycobacterium sp.]|nr:hypothetical protein [Mycobacterium sp.]